MVWKLFHCFDTSSFKNEELDNNRNHPAADCTLCDVSPAGIGRLALPAPRGATDDRQVFMVVLDCLNTVQEKGKKIDLPGKLSARHDAARRVSRRKMTNVLSEVFAGGSLLRRDFRLGDVWVP